MEKKERDTEEKRVLVENVNDEFYLINTHIFRVTLLSLDRNINQWNVHRTAWVQKSILARNTFLTFTTTARSRGKQQFPILIRSFTVKILFV